MEGQLVGCRISMNVMDNHADTLIKDGASDIEKAEEENLASGAVLIDYDDDRRIFRKNLRRIFSH
jgi:hypothetical protein